VFCGNYYHLLRHTGSPHTHTHTHTHTTAYNHIHQHTQNYIQNYIGLQRSIKTQKKTKMNFKLKTCPYCISHHTFQSVADHVSRQALRTWRRRCRRFIDAMTDIGRCCIFSPPHPPLPHSPSSAPSAGVVWCGVVPVRCGAASLLAGPVSSSSSSDLSSSVDDKHRQSIVCVKPTPPPTDVAVCLASLAHSSIAAL